VACFVDSTVFAIWTSITAVGSIAAAAKNFRKVFLRRVIDSINQFIANTKMMLKTSSGRKRILLFMSITAAVPIFIKIVYEIFRIDEKIDDMTLMVKENTADPNFDVKGSFVRAMYSFDPSDKSNYLSFIPGDVILISKEDLHIVEGPNSKWIVGKMKNGENGYFPSNYVAVIK